MTKKNDNTSESSEALLEAYLKSRRLTIREQVKLFDEIEALVVQREKVVLVESGKADLATRLDLHEEYIESNASRGVRGVFSGEDLSGVDLRNRNLAHTDFENTNLRGADFTGAYLDTVIFRGANLTDAKGISGAAIKLSTSILMSAWLPHEVANSKEAIEHLNELAKRNRLVGDRICCRPLKIVKIKNRYKVIDC